MDPQTATLVGGVISGGVAVKFLEILWAYFNGKATAKRREVDRIATLLQEAKIAQARAEKREHLATVWGRRLELIAVQYGVPESDMPVLDFQED